MYSKSVDFDDAPGPNSGLKGQPAPVCGRIGAGGGRLRPGIVLTAVFWLALLFLVARPAVVVAQTVPAVSGFSVTNYTGYVIAGDTDPGGRQAIRTSTRMAYSNPSTSPETDDFQLRYQLLDGAGTPVAIADENGQSNTTYSVTQTVSLPVTLLQPPFFIHTELETNAAPLLPLARLNPYQQYTVSLNIFERLHNTGNYTNTGAQASFGPNFYYQFTNTASPDPSPNLLVTLNAASLERAWAITNSPGQGGFLVNAGASVRRYDDFTLPPAATNTTVAFNFTLIDYASGAVVPLQATQSVAQVSIESHDTNSPPFPEVVAVATNFSLVPVGQLDSVDKTYQILVNVTHTEAGRVISDQTNVIGPVQLLEFNGQMRGGSFLSYFTNFDSAPVITGSVTNDHLDCVLPITLDAGWLPGAPGYTYGDGTGIPVSFFVDGSCQIATGAVASIHGPAPPARCAGNICFQVASLQLTSGGAAGSVTLNLPSGLSVSTNPNSRLTVATVSYASAPLDEQLVPAGALTVPGPFRVVAETLPFWFNAPNLTWQAASGEIAIDPTGGVFARQEEDDILTNAQARSLLANPNAANRISNDGYLRNAIFAGGQLLVTAGPNGDARISTSLGLNPIELRPHFPYSGGAPGQQIPVSGGLFAIENGLVATNSFLGVSGPVPVSYARDGVEATNCGLEQIGPAVLAFTPDSDQLGFTMDGGLLASGAVPAGTSLAWGYAGGGNFAQQVTPVSACVYEMPGVFLRGDQTALDPRETGVGLLLSGFGDVSLDPSYVERPGQANYASGGANYAGLNFRQPAAAPNLTAQSFVGQTNVGPYPLTSDSRYYARYGGVSGIHEAASFPSTLQLYGYNFTFNTYLLSYLDSEVAESRTDGALAFPQPPTGPAGFTQEFADMLFSDRGDLVSADVPSSSTNKHLAYWNVDITPQSIEFNSANTDTCGTGQRWLVLGVETKLPLIPQPFHASLGFQPSGNLTTPADGVTGADSRFPVPAQLSLQGPGGDPFIVSTVGPGYFNNWTTPGAPANGFFNLAGTMRAPFFTDIRVHLHAAPLNATNAQIAIMGGWPSPNTTATDYGWSVNGTNYFNSAAFDPTSDGWPVAQVAISGYESSTNLQYHPRAQRDWIEVATFDYPLQWNAVLREFAGFQDATVILPVIDVNSRLKEISPGKVDLDFAQDVTLQLPQIKVLDFLNDIVNEVDGPFVSVSNAVYGALTATFDTIGLNELQQVLREDAQSFFAPALDTALAPVATNLFNQLAAFPQSDMGAFLSNAVYLVNTAGLNTALSGLNGGPGQAGTVIGQLDTTLTDVQRDLGLVAQILARDPTTSNRMVVSAILKQLVADQGPALKLASLADSEVDSLISGLDPALDSIQSQFADVNNQIGQIHADLLAASGNFAQALSQPLGDATGLGQFVQAASANLTNYLASVLTPAGDYFTANPGAAQQAIQQQLVTAFLGSAIPADYQQTFRQFLFDPNALQDQLMDALFGQINTAIQDGLVESSQIPGGAGGALEAVKGLASGSFLTAKIRGSPTFNGDSLRKIHLDAAIQVNVPGPMNFNAYMEILELDSQSSPVDCVPAGDPAAEITLGAQDVKLDWTGYNPLAGPALTLGAEAKWTLQNSNVIGIGGSFDIKGDVSFQGCAVKEIGAALAFGATENYFAAKAAGSILVIAIPVDVQVGIFAGKACSLDPVKFIDPQADQVLGPNANGFTGIYVECGGGLSLSDIIFGSSSCLLDVDATVSTAYFINGSPGQQQIGMRQTDELDLSLLCVLSGGASTTMYGSAEHFASGYQVILGGSAQICGSIGPCPFCVSGCKGITISGTVEKGGIEYKVNY
jgi:hypothetical protein